MQAFVTLNINGVTLIGQPGSSIIMDGVTIFFPKNEINKEIEKNCALQSKETEKKCVSQEKETFTVKLECGTPVKWTSKYGGKVFDAFVDDPEGIEVELENFNSLSFGGRRFAISSTEKLSVDKPKKNYVIKMPSGKRVVKNNKTEIYFTTGDEKMELTPGTKIIVLKGSYKFSKGENGEIIRDKTDEDQKAIIPI
jgi:hypothetical protein